MHSGAHGVSFGTPALGTLGISRPLRLGIPIALCISGQILSGSSLFYMLIWVMGPFLGRSLPGFLFLLLFSAVFKGIDGIQGAGFAIRAGSPTRILQSLFGLVREMAAGPHGRDCW
jgi:hypothetical protein